MLTDVKALIFELAAQIINLPRLHPNKVQHLFNFRERRILNALIASRLRKCIVIRIDDVRNTADLHAMQLPEISVWIVNSQTNIPVALQRMKFQAAL